MDLVNTAMLSCGILAAPDGIYSIEGNVLTIKAGLKLLWPQGRAADGTKITSVYTVPANITQSYAAARSRAFVGINAAGKGLIEGADNGFFVADEQPAAALSAFWYSPKDNKIRYVGGSGVIGADVIAVVLCVDRDSSGNVTALTPFSIVDILGRQDKKEITSWSAPSEKSTTLTLGASGSTYIAPAKGKFNLKFTTTSSNQGVDMQTFTDNTLSTLVLNKQPEIATTGRTTATDIDVDKGQVLKVGYGGVTPVSFRFVYAKGEVI
ncbi:hypothetical protein AAIR98_001429 [Elusimicrobium simillimum]